MNQHVEHLDQAEQVAPLSYAQQRLWLLDQLLPTGSVYNIGDALRISGQLDPAALRGALNELVRRHEALRTRFGMQDGQPVQVIAPELKIALAIEDLLECAPDERANEAQRRAQAEAEAPFDLANGPLIRARLVRLTPSEHWLLLTLHHIVTDGWSSGVLRRELATLYNAYHRGEPSPLPALPLQYAGYALWQRQRLQGAVLEKQLGFWRQALADLPALDLPTDRPRPAESSYRGGCIKFDVPESLTHSLKALSRREGATLFMTLLAAYQILLFRYSGQEDIAVGVPIAGRPRLEVEGLIGFFVNTLVLRGDLSGEPNFRTYLAQVRNRALDAYEHQDLPFEKLVEELAPKRDLSRNPLFQASLVLQNTPSEYWQLPGLDVQKIEVIHNATAKFDLDMSLTERGGALAGRLEFATDLFDAGTIERMAAHFLRLLEAIAAEPECRIGELPMLTPEERQQLLVGWNDTAADYPRDRCIHQLFEEQAASTPEGAAVVFEGRQLTYAELDARANQLAHHLRALGVGPDVLVGICVERSLELVVGLLGILKAGGAYVPLDPELPRARLAFMLEDATAPVLVTQQALLERLPQYPTTVCMDRDRAAFAARPTVNPTPLNQPSHLAYVMYTSGSTGMPKGVAITHSALVNFLWSMRNQPGCHKHDVLLSVTTVSFDIAGLELYLPLIAGGQVALANHDEAADGRLLKDCIERCKPTMMQATPATWRMVVEAGWSGTPGMVVLCGGESLPLDLAEALRARTAAVWNMYGPTETTIWSTAAHYSTDTARLTIGRPVANTMIYVLDQHRQPVPVGVAGELYIGGDGLARGYWNRPELTAERFVPDPFSEHPGARLYRTGDRARYLPDGSLEFLGRLDTQVKLRGFRIELGEIEGVLARQPAVRAVVVLLREDVPGDQRLVAYVVPRNEDLSATDLRAWLKQQLPLYMVPAAFVLLPALPLTPNGKVNRRALPAPETETRDLPHDLPTTPIESIIAKTWADVLNLTSVGIDDDFFDLGGHSLLAVRLMSRINQALALNLNLRQLFETPTVRNLALAALDSMVAGADDDAALQPDEAVR